MIGISSNNPFILFHNIKDIRHADFHNWLLSFGQADICYALSHSGIIHTVKECDLPEVDPIKLCFSSFSDKLELKCLQNVFALIWPSLSAKNRKILR